MSITAMKPSMYAPAKGRHPLWCIPSDACVGEDARAVEHAGRLSQFYGTRDDVRVSIRLLHHEDRHPVTGVDEGSTDIHLSLLNVACDGVAADVHLSPGEASLLADYLARYARDAAHDTLWFDAVDTEGGVR